MLCRDCALRRVDLESARRCPWSADAGLEADIEPRESGSARRRSSRDTPSLPRSESREHESWPEAADSCAPHRSIWRGCGPATVEENSTIPPSPRVVKGLERVAVVIAIKGSRIARSRPTAARMRGRSKAKRLERATREPHNRFRRPIEVDTDSGLVTGYIPRRSLGWSGSAEAETAWRERPHLWPRARSQTRSDLVVAHATAALCIVAQGSVPPTVRPTAPPGFSAPK